MEARIILGESVGRAHSASMGGVFRFVIDLRE
jgi:hypothetical protein